VHLFPQGKFWAAFVGNNISTRYDWFDAFASFTRQPAYDPYATLINGYVWVPAMNDSFIASNLEYTKLVINQPYFQNITAISQTSSAMQISNLASFTIELYYSILTGCRDIFVTRTYGDGVAILAGVFGPADATARPLIDAVNISFSINFQPQPQIVAGSECKQWQSLQSAYQHQLGRSGGRRSDRGPSQEVRSSDGAGGADRGAG
jgi:hypothetical protein